MNQKQLGKYKAQLKDLLSQISSDTNSVRTQFQNHSNDDSQLSKAPMHLADNGTEEFINDLNTVLIENEEYLLREIEAAFKRLETNAYGKCESCGATIASARLEAIPYARFCIQCADSNHEGPDLNLNRGRPQNPDDTLAPEGFMNEDRKVRELNSGGLVNEPASDRYAVGEAGGGTAIGGLAGTNIGRGEPDVADLQDSIANGSVDKKS